MKLALLKLKNGLKLVLPKGARSFLRAKYSSFRIKSSFLRHKSEHLILRRNFLFNKQKFAYFISEFNTTFNNERAVEIPIVMETMAHFRDKNILEIGNVTSHYFKPMHDIVDKYEKGPGVINCDIIDFKPVKNYDLIISISTFEHIGFDESIRYGEEEDNSVRREALISAIENTRKLLNKNGLFIFTVPLGFNSFLDSKLKNNGLNLDESYYLKRLSKKNEWEQVPYESAIQAKYGTPYNCANGLLIGIIKKGN